MIVLAVNEGINGSVVVAEQGRILYALQEERVNRVKEYHGFPHQALDLALADLGLTPADVTDVCLCNLESPYLTKEQFQALYEWRASRSWEHGLSGAMRRFKDTLRDVTPRPILEARHSSRHGRSARQIAAHLEQHGLGHAAVHRTHHHLNHAAAAYFGCRQDPDSEHLVLTLDGGGDRECAHVYRANAGSLQLLATTPVGHSLGNIYAIATQVSGMTPHEHEYKLMGLAAYTPPQYSQAACDRFRTYLDLDPDNPLCFRRKTAESTVELQRRMLRDLQRVRFDTLASGLQCFTEELICRWVAAAVAATGVHRVVASGGVFMNVKANKVVAELPGVEYFDVFPSAGDESLPFGAAWLHAARQCPDRQAELRLEHLYLGPDGGYDLARVQPQLEREARLEVRRLREPEREVAALLATGEVVARCSGRMEFGARALGNRSILADPADARVIPRINRMIKQRDFWMPFAPAVLREEVDRYLQVPSSLPGERVSPYMMHTFATTEARDELIAGVHQYDLTSRAQVVRRETNAAFYDLISHFHRLTGRGAVLNTSFNLHGEPIVMGTADALHVLLRSGLTHVVVNDLLIRKRPSPEALSD